MSGRASRGRSAIAGFCPLVALALLSFVTIFVRGNGLGDDLSDHLIGTMIATVLFGLGPPALWVAVWPLGGMAVAFVTIWAAYAVSIACTRFGLAPWWVHAILSTAWSVSGVFARLFGSLAVT